MKLVYIVMPIVGAGLLVAAGWLVAPAAGMAIAGIMLLVIGELRGAIERRKR